MPPVDDPPGPLASLIRREIESADGVISFQHFMELALYAPNLGYYEHSPATVGSRGDFYTSVSVGTVFGELLAAALAPRIRALLARGLHPSLVEAGAHGGFLAADILDHLDRHEPDIATKVVYTIVEPSPTRRQWQAGTLARWNDRVRWADTVPPFDGVLLANELLDAFPIRRFGWNRGLNRWLEWGVGEGASGFEWRPIPDAQASPDEQPPMPPELLAVLPDGYIAETCTPAAQWWMNAAQALHHGWMITFDYGGTREELWSPARHRGTLRAYRQHRLIDNPLADPGSLDLTAHVDFTAIRQAGESAGLTTEVYVGQGTYLARIAQEIQRDPGRSGAFPKWTPERVRQFQTLTHPEHLGHKFRVLIQGRNP